mmetsp:Transcript_9035/g.31462  ORF Transcript_9035/g.31462 Transcript_9035/m.31462 type:complete len:341 (-) Transcript_9035:2309-3331(-)
MKQSWFSSFLFLFFLGAQPSFGAWFDAEHSDVLVTLHKLRQAQYELAQVVASRKEKHADSTSLSSLPPTPPEDITSCTSAKDCPASRMMCWNSTCHCPILFPGGQNCDSAREPSEPWCLTPFKRWHSKGPVYKGQDFTACAVVGSASTLLREEEGPSISEHTAIFRFNEAPSKRHEKYVGKGTTLRFQNRDRSGYAEYKGEICVVRRGKWYKSQDSGGKCQMHQMPALVEQYVDNHWKIYRGGPVSPGKPWFSNGFTGVVFALHLCARVDVYGMTSGTGYYFTKYKGQARNWGRRNGYIGPPTKPMANRHSWPKEKSCLHKLAHELPHQLILHNSAYGRL